MSNYYNQVKYQWQIYPRFIVEETSENRVSIYVEELSKTWEETKTFIVNIKLEKAFDWTHNFQDVNNEINDAMWEYSQSIDKNKNQFELNSKDQLNEMLIKRLKNKFSYNIEWNENEDDSSTESLDIESSDQFSHIKVAEVKQPIAKNSFYEYLFWKFQELRENDYYYIKATWLWSPNIFFSNEQVNWDLLWVKWLSLINIYAKSFSESMWWGWMNDDELEEMESNWLNMSYVDWTAFSTSKFWTFEICFYSELFETEMFRYRYELKDWNFEKTDDKTAYWLMECTQNIAKTITDIDLYWKVVEQFSKCDFSIIDDNNHKNIVFESKKDEIEKYIDEAVNEFSKQFDACKFEWFDWIYDRQFEIDKENELFLRIQLESDYVKMKNFFQTDNPK